MTRQNITDGVREILTKRCPTCDGEGVVESEETVAIDVLRHLRELVADQPKPEAFLIRVHPKVARQLLEPDSGLRELEDESGKHFHFEGGEALPLSTYQVSESGSRSDIERRALPFGVGDEVLVTIEEPHMYNVDDAVARVDAYVVSVTGGGSHVGERRMVRIEEVGRSVATASLLDAPSGGSADSADAAARGREGEQGAGGNSLESKPSSGRRRGRRGGRRRSRAASGEKNDG